MKRKFVLLAVVAAAIFLGGWLAVGPAKNQGYAPVQPLPFSHKTHAGQYQVPCMYCHSSVERSRHATVPGMNVCMNCHRLVTMVNNKPSPYIQELTKQYNAGQPLPWIKVHDLPEFTYFNHQRHIAKNVACETCHGDVKNMARVKQFAPLTMGWCVNCHRKPEYNAPTSCDTCHR